MTGPDFDADGYPTDATLERIRTWAIQSNADFADVMDFAGRAWSYPDRWECIERWEDPDWPGYPKRVYRFSTGGWSGNESVVDAIEGNAILQMVGAWSWQRGGHYEYRLPITTEGVETAKMLAVTTSVTTDAPPSEPTDALIPS